MRDILNAEETARVMHCGSQMVRERIKRGIWNFGTVVTAKQSGKRMNSYEINKVALADFLRISPEEIDRRLAGEG